MAQSGRTHSLARAQTVEYGPFQIAANGIGKQGRQIFQQTLFAGYRTFAANAGRAEQVDQVHEQCWADGMMREMKSTRLNHSHQYVNRKPSSAYQKKIKSSKESDMG